MKTLQHLIKPIVTVPYSMNIAGVAVTMTLNKLHCVLVEHHDGSLGIITEKDIVRDVVARCKEASRIRAWEIMRQPVIMVDEYTTISDAVDIMKSHSIRNLIVTSGDTIKGVVKRSTILNSLQLEQAQKFPWIHNKTSASQEIT